MTARKVHGELEKRVIQIAVGALVLGLVGGACGSGSDDAPAAAAGGIPAEASAGGRKTWVLSSSSRIKVPAPPKASSEAAKSELAELKDLVGKRTPQMEQEAHHWSDYPALEPWISENMELVSEQSKNPPLASRCYAWSAWPCTTPSPPPTHWRYTYKREAPKGTNPVVPVGTDPSYPNEHAAIAGAASRVLAYLFPERPTARWSCGRRRSTRN